jgi:type VI secretion system protein ImpK
VARFDKKNERSSFIVECFEEFYREILKHRNFVISKPWQKTETQGESSPQATAEYILSRLQTFLEEQSLTAKYGGNSFAENYYEEAKFIMVSLADEIFLNLDWPGKRYWEFNLLEQRIYNTHSAGQVFFERLDELLTNKDPVRADLAVLYLNALGLGFQGKYRHFNDAGALNSYRKRLFVFINRREPYLFQKKIHLFPDAYVHTLEGSEVKELPNLRNWYLIFAGIGLSYFFVSYVIWYSATSDIMKIVNRIIASNSGNV